MVVLLSSCCIEDAHLTHPVGQSVQVRDLAK